MEGLAASMLKGIIFAIAVAVFAIIVIVIIFGIDKLSALFSIFFSLCKNAISNLIFI